MAENDVTGAIKREIDLIEYARWIGLEPVPHGNQGKYRSKVHDSLVLDSRAGLFSWNSRSLGGSVIDLAMAYHGYNNTEAISHLRRLMTSRPEHKPLRRPPARAEPPPPKPFSLPEKSSSGYGRLFGYLLKNRKLEKSVVESAIKQNLLYQDGKGNACFVGYDYDKTPKYASLRGTHSDIQFRGDVAGSKKEIGFTVNLLERQCTALVVTEAPIDALSFMSLLMHYERDPDAYGYVSLGGTTELALLYHVKQNPNIRTIYLCQDNDTAGDTSRQTCRAALAAAGFAGKVVDKPPHTKDYNDDLKQLVENQQTPTQERRMQHEQTISR